MNNWYIVNKIIRDGKVLGCQCKNLITGEEKRVRKSDLRAFCFSNATISSDLRIIQKRGARIGEVYEDGTKEQRKRGKKADVNKVILYHGSPNQTFTPIFGAGEDKHDYGRGFYLTEHKELAKEWAVCTGQPGYLHTYELDLTGLRIFNFNKESSMIWLAELMSHRVADNSARYRKWSKVFIDKFKKDISAYDVIYGWRADSSYFNIAKRFVRDEIDYNLIGELFKLGDLENQWCLKSPRAFAQLKEIKASELVDLSYAQKYRDRDDRARQEMTELIESDRNTMKKGFTYVIERL